MTPPPTTTIGSAPGLEMTGWSSTSISSSNGVAPPSSESGVPPPKYQINTEFLKMMFDFRFYDSFPVKTGSCPTAMVDPSFDAEYPSCPGLAEVSDPKNVNFRFYRRKTGEKPEIPQWSKLGSNKSSYSTF